MRVFLWVVVGLTLVGVGAGFTYHYWPLKLNLHAPGIRQTVTASAQQTRVFVPDRVLLGEVAQFDDALFAFLMFDYLRGRSLLHESQVMLTAQEESGQPVYRVVVRLPDDIVSGTAFLAELKQARLTPSVQSNWVLPRALESAEAETKLFVKAYREPATEQIKATDEAQLQSYLRKFIRFKSETDPRIERSIGTIPSPLTRTDASRMAADIIAIASFYNIPVDLFLGIGAMENNYMNVAGDLKNTAWKSRPEPGDIVIRRRRGRVLVRNDSTGVWQITRESLRYAHKLYLKDKRDYDDLPERLRPPHKLVIDSVDPEVLTTYAGLLLRDLLDHFDGDVTLAAGAYNGGVDNPNLHYANGVEVVANYARRVIGRASDIHKASLEHSTVSSERINTQPVLLAHEAAKHIVKVSQVVR